MAEEKKSTIVNIIALTVIVIVNVTITFFLLKFMLGKTQESILEKQSQLIAEAKEDRENLVKPKAKKSTGTATSKVDSAGNPVEEIDIDEFEGYDPQLYTNFPLEDLYANIEGRFLVVTMNLKFFTENKDLQEILSTALPDIRANILSLLRRESIQDLEDVTYTKKLGTKIKNRINQVIQNKEQEAGIEYVLFTQFIIE